jgi:hypothetical protein
MHSTLAKPSPRAHIPFQLIVIACFQFMKAGFLLTAVAFLWLAPDLLPNSSEFSQMLYIAAHGKTIPAVLVPTFALYIAYVGYGLLRLRRSVRRNLALSSVVTICASLQRLGVFGESSMISRSDREGLYILILLDLAVYIYLAFHPEITRLFKRTY